LSNGRCINGCDGNFGTGTPNACPVNAGNCMNNGRCRGCTSDTDCGGSDGPPSTARLNTICGSGGICVDPFTCGITPASSVDNQGCRNAYPGGGKNNCWTDGSCLSCTSNADCYARDGGRIPRQPFCDTTQGVCSSCRSNEDCPPTARNCNADGFCYDCKTFTNGDCLALDGPPPGNIKEPNCDTVTGTCVSFCTRDEHCYDACLPHCQLERGCCVECRNHDDCPVEQWRGSQTNNRFCSSEHGYKCVPSLTPITNYVCMSDHDCRNRPDTPACSRTENSCVSCIFDSHCGYPTPACASFMQKCVECVFDAHCYDEAYNPENNDTVWNDQRYCGSDLMCHDNSHGPNTGIDSGLGVRVGLPLLIFAILARMF